MQRPAFEAEIHEVGGATMHACTMSTELLAGWLMTDD